MTNDTTDADEPSGLDKLPQPDFEGTIDADELEVDGDNPNEMSDDQFGLLKKKMRQNGWLGGPIITDTDGLIADGEHRWRAAVEIGLDEVKVRQYDIDDATRRLWRQELNKIHGEHDEKRDALEYDYLLDAGKTDEVHDLTKAAEEDLDELLAKIKMETASTPTYEYDPDHNVYFEDCVEGMRERLADDSVDCVLTDPPYGVNVDLNDSMGRKREVQHAGTVKADKGIEEAVELWRRTVEEVTRVAKDDAHLYCFASWKTGHAFRQVLESFGWKIQSLLVWVKNDANHLTQFGAGDGGNARFGYKHEFCYFATRENPRPIEGYPNDVLEYKEPRFEAEWMDKDVQHPTMKPVTMLRDLIGYSTREGDLVLDPFMGSGSTAVAAVETDRDYIGFELDGESYRTVIERRIGEAKRQRDAGVNKPEEEEAEADD